MDDFDRNVWCLLGLPFDAVSLNETVYKIHNAAKNKTPLFTSTPNLNFLIASQKDKKFRDSVINSDLVVMDGQPLVWLAKLLRIPIPERVAGSDLIDALIENKEGYKPLKVFFFGGQDGIAEQACDKLNAQNKGLQCVGYHNPGFGTVEEMSSIKIIEKINESGADFIIVSLGAKKGQAWIEYNKDKLIAPIISHLGAVVNFIAGNVKRSPKIMQKIGLEWLWRIKEEPLLWKRYINDGLSLLGLIIIRVIPAAYFIFLNKNSLQEVNEIIIEKEVDGDVDVFNISGVIIEDNLFKFKAIFKNIGCLSKNIQINLNKVKYIDLAFVGYILSVHGNLLNHKINLNIISESKLINKIFIYNNCGFLINNYSK